MGQPETVKKPYKSIQEAIDQSMVNKPPGPWSSTLFLLTVLMFAIAMCLSGLFGGSFWLHEDIHQYVIRRGRRGGYFGGDEWILHILNINDVVGRAAIVLFVLTLASAFVGLVRVSINPQRRFKKVPKICEVFVWLAMALFLFSLLFRTVCSLFRGTLDHWFGITPIVIP